ncbi:MAG TPA: LamG domain-containing protein, partial [bacterium]|nr:LamG domain-containing protein [bacterium]
SNTAGAELFEFQFNEVRYNEVANAASTTAAPASATVSVAGWQVDAGRAGFKGDGATGALGNSGLVATGHALDQSGSMTISWWQRMNTATGTSLAYAFGGTGGNWRCFTGGVAGTGLWYRGSSIGDVTSNAINVQANPGVWEHVCLVVDDSAGTAEWYLNGVPDGPTLFTPGTHTGTNSEYHVGYHTSTVSIYTDHYDMDDYRHYTRALSPAEVLALFNGTENPAATNYGTACAGGSGTPTLTANGAPDGTAGNAGFAISLGGAQPLAISAIAFGYSAGTFPLLPLDLGTVLGPNFAGCMLETDALAVFAHLTDVTGAATQPIPITGGGGLNGTHLYGQWVTFDTTVGSLTAAIDINVE